MSRRIQNPTPAPPQKRAALQPTRDRLRDAAAGLFAQKGYDGVSIREITRAVGIKESSLYNHFPSKKDLLTAVLDHFQTHQFPKAPSDAQIDAALSSLGPSAFMKAAVTRFVEHWDDPDRKTSWFVVSMEQFKNKRAADIIVTETAGVVRTTEMIFRKMLEQRMIRPCDPQAAAAAYAYALRAIHLEYELLKTHGLDTREALEKLSALVDFFMDLLAVGSGNPAGRKKSEPA